MNAARHLRAEVVQRYLAGALSDDARGDAHRHIEACDECRSLLVAAAAVVTREPDAADGPAAVLPAVPEEHYEIEREIARGGLGKILSARHVPLDRVVAVKELIHDDERHHARFVREALVTASLQHPGIVPVHEAGRWPSGEPFYTMKLVAGRSLQEVLEQTSGLDARLALLPRLIAVGEALAYAHARGVIHRDVKPANILLGEYGETVLIDWGLAKRVTAGAAGAADAEISFDPLISVEETAAGAVLGTPRYMSPEQASGSPADARSDVYSLGVVLYELLAGCSPYAAGAEGLDGIDVRELERRIVDGRVAPVRTREPEVPRDLATIVERALAVDPALRYPGAGALVDDLQRFTTGRLISRRYTSGELVRRWLRRHARLVAVCAAALFALAVTGAAGAVRVARARRDAQDSVARLELDEGRLAYLGGDPLLSLAYLAAAIRDGADGPVARYLLARATDSVTPQRLVLDAHSGGTYRATFSPDGTRLATAGEDGKAIVWDPATGARLHVLEGHEGQVFAAEWSPDGTRLVTAGLDGVVRVWDPAGGRLLAALEGHRGYVPGVRFSPDGRLLASWDLMGGVRLWDLPDGVLRFALEAHGGRVAEVRFIGDDRILSAGSDGLARIWSARTGAPICVAANPAPAGIVIGLSPDGLRFATGSVHGEVAVHESAGCKLLARWRAGVQDVGQVTFDPGGKRILVAGLGGARLWDAETGELLATVEEHELVKAAAFSADGNRLVWVGNDRLVHIWNVRDGQPLALLAGHRAYVRTVSFSPDQRRIVSASVDGTVRLWDAAPGGTPAVDPGLHRLMPQRGGHLLAITNGGGDLLRHDAGPDRWTLLAGAVCPESARNEGPTSVACQLGEGVVLRARDGTADLIDGASGRTRWTDPLRRVRAAALSPGSTRAATLSATGEVRISDVATGAEIRTLLTGQHLRGVDFVDEGRVVTVGPAQVTIWDVATGAALLTLPGANIVRDHLRIAIDPSRGRILVPSLESEAPIYDLASGARIATLHGQTTAFRSGDFSIDGSIVATHHDDGAVRLWDASSGLLLDAIRYGLRGDLAFDPAGDALLTVDIAGELQRWSLARDVRPLAEIARFVDACVPYQVEHGAVRSRELPPGSCRRDR